MKKATLKRRLLFTLALLPFTVSAEPQWGLKVDPFVLIPFDNPSGLEQGGKDVDLYSMGYGLGVTANMNFAGFLSPFVSLDVGEDVLKRLEILSILDDGCFVRR